MFTRFDCQRLRGRRSSQLSELWHMRCLFQQSFAVEGPVRQLPHHLTSLPTGSKVIFTFDLPDLQHVGVHFVCRLHDLPAMISPWTCCPPPYRSAHCPSDFKTLQRFTFTLHAPTSTSATLYPPNPILPSLLLLRTPNMQAKTLMQGCPKSPMRSIRSPHESSCGIILST